MALHYGFSEKEKNFKIKNEKSVQYTLKYPKNVLQVSTYPKRPETEGYQYIPAFGLTNESTITFLCHSFSTAVGEDISGGTTSYSFEFLTEKGNFSYFVIDELSLNKYKIPKAGALYNIFFLNKTYKFSDILKTTNLEQFSMFCISFTQKTGVLSDDASELELLITY